MWTYSISLKRNSNSMRLLWKVEKEICKKFLHLGKAALNMTEKIRELQAGEKSKKRKWSTKYEDQDLSCPAFTRCYLDNNTVLFT